MPSKLKNWISTRLYAFLQHSCRVEAAMVYKLVRRTKPIVEYFVARRAGLVHALLVGRAV